jgi:hypothetical protein
VIDETQKDFLGNPLKVDVPYVETGSAPPARRSSTGRCRCDPVRDPGHDLVGYRWNAG